MLTQHNNDCAREARPNIWVFQGKTLILLVASVTMGLGVFKSLVTAFDWEFSAAIGLVPLGLTILLVTTLINGKPKSYLSDWLLLGVWKAKTAAYLAGAKDRPSALWIKDKTPRHPKKF